MINNAYLRRIGLGRFRNLNSVFRSISAKPDLLQVTQLLIPEKFKSKVRNIGISAHIDSGKTTLSERILFYTGKIKAIHDVRGRDGVGAKMDHMELEREKGITIQSAATFCQWHDFSINLIDTPGHVDFTIEVERALRVLDGAVLVMCAVAGVQPQTLTVDRQMRRYNIPRVVYINKMDRVGANPVKAVHELREVLKLNAALIQIPIGVEDEFEGVVDLINRCCIRFSGTFGEIETISSEIPENLVNDVESARSELVSRLANVDALIEDLYLNETDPSPMELELAIRKAVIGHKFTPVMMGSAYKNRAVQPLLDGICKYLPSPTDVTSTAFEIEDEALYQQARMGSLRDASAGSKLHGGSRSDVKASAGSTAQQQFRQAQAAAKVAAATPDAEKGKNAVEVAKERMNKLLKPFSVNCEANKPTIALAFKLDESKFGQLTYVRIYQGVITKGMMLYNSSSAKKFKVPRLVRMHSDEMQDIQEASAGDVICLFGLDGICSMDTLTDGTIKTVMNPMFVPEPVISISIKPKLTTMQTAFGKAINKFTREDPTLRIAQDEKTKQLLLSGMGELHLEIYVERLRREFGIDCDVGSPSVNYKETVRRRTSFDYLHKKQSGGQGQYGRVIGYIEAMTDDEVVENDGVDVKFVNHLIGLNIPPEFVPSIEKGMLDVVNEGAISGHQITKVKFVLNDGVAHPVDSTDLAFRTAGAQAMRQAVRNADPIILEPLMTVDVTVPTEYQASVVGGLNKRQGSIIGTETSSDGGSSLIKAEVPLSQMIGYATDLRSVTKGKGEFSLEYCRHCAVISAVQDVLVRKYQEQLHIKVDDNDDM